MQPLRHANEATSFLSQFLNDEQNEKTALRPRFNDLEMLRELINSDEMSPRPVFVQDGIRNREKACESGTSVARQDGTEIVRAISGE